MVCRRNLSHSASHFVRGNVLDKAWCVSLCLCTSLFLQHAQTHSGVLQTLALRVLVTDIISASEVLAQMKLSRKTELLQRQLKAHKKFPVTTCNLSKSTSIAETSTTTPAYPSGLRSCCSAAQPLFPLQLLPAWVTSFHYLLQLSTSALIVSSPAAQRMLRQGNVHKDLLAGSTADDMP